jgi:hypothetical protein
MRRECEPRFLVAATALAVVVFVGLAAAQTEVWRGEARIPDTPIYRDYGDRVTAGQVPYRDFRVEYPPGALPAFVAPSLVSRGGIGYARAFGALMTACGVLMVLFVGLALAALGAGRWRTVLALGIPAATPLLLGPLVLTRFDLFPAALLAAAIAALVAGRDRLGIVTLGAATAVKLYPAVLLPLVVAHIWRRRDRREAAVAAGLALGLVVAAYAVFAVLAPGGVGWSLWRQLGRPLQIESLGSAALLTLHHLAGIPLDWESGHGSQNLTGVAAVVAALAVSLIQIALLVWLWVRYARGPAQRERLVLYAAGAVTVFVAFGKVLSPQFLVWLLPLVPLVAGRRGLAASVLLVPGCLLTRGWFPADYWALVREFDGQASTLLVLRDLCLVALAAVLVWPTASRREPARSSSPGPSPRHT